MFQAYNYALIIKVAEDFQALSATEKEELKDVLATVREDWIRDTSLLELSNSTLLEKVLRWHSVLKVPPGKGITIDDFLIIYAATTVPEELSGVKYYKELFGLIKADPIVPHLKGNTDRFRHYVIAHFLLRTKTSWQELTENADLSKWKEIHAVSSMMPILLPSCDQLKIWLADVTQRHENDWALADVSHWFHQWLLVIPNEDLPSDRQIAAFCSHGSLCRYCSPLVKAFSERRAKNFDQLADCMFPAASMQTSFFVGFALGFAALSSGNRKDEYFELLNKYRASGTLKLADFFKICAAFQLHREKVFDLISAIDPSIQDKDVWIGVLNLLLEASDNIDKTWKEKTTITMFSRYEPELTRPLDELLCDIISKDTSFAWELVEFRLSITGGHEMLERSFVILVNQQQDTFQQYLIKWLGSEDTYLHMAVRKITSMRAFTDTLFSLQKKFLDCLTDSDKLYLSIKTAGYVYTMEALQQLLISIVKSVDNENELLKQNFLFLFRDYLVYNYRSTLSMLKKELELPELAAFARKLFEEVVQYFEQYFEEMRELHAPKELTPSEHYKRLYQFYFQAKYGSIPKAARKSSLLQYFTNTPINANKSAMKRDNELTHVVVPLGHVSVSGEFPSGEKLNPVYQEYIRRTYQKLKRNEIDID